MTDLDLKVAQAIDVNGDQPWVWEHKRVICDRKCNEYDYAECPGTNGPCICQQDIPLKFSTSPEAAWMLLRHMTLGNYKVEISCHGVKVSYVDLGIMEMVYTSEKVLLPKALCLAFLQAKGEK